MAGGATVGTRRRTHALGAVTDALARRTAKCRSSAIDVADDAVREHVVAVADVAGLRIRGRGGHADPVEELQADDPGVVLADAGIVHDHARTGHLAALKAL